MKWNAEQQEKQAIDDLVDHGWQKINYISQYLTLKGDKQILKVYMIHPDVLIPFDKEFQENLSVELDAGFEEWIDSLPEDKFVLF